MADAFKKLACCLLLLALAGTVAGAGYGAAEKSGGAAPVKLSAAGSSCGNSGLPRITGESGLGGVLSGTKCYFPIINLPAYYICIMFCKIGGGGDTCAPSCEAKLMVCT